MEYRRDEKTRPDIAPRPLIAPAGRRLFRSIERRCCSAGRRIASEQQKILAETLPHGRLELFAGYGHGVNLLQPERCARAALDFWRTVEAEDK
jgi:pimeloyl-ACP methyl ester carboxylesterase